MLFLFKVTIHFSVHVPSGRTTSKAREVLKCNSYSGSSKFLTIRDLPSSLDPAKLKQIEDQAA